MLPHMNAWTARVIVLLAVTTSTSAHAQTQDGVRERVARLIAAQSHIAAVEKHISDATANADPRVTDELVQQMLDDPRKYKTVENGRSRGEQYVFQQIRSEVVSVAQARLNRLNAGKQWKPIEMAELGDVEGWTRDRWVRYATVIYPAQFRNARQRAVQKQAEQLSREIPPPVQAEMERQLGDWKSGRAHLATKLTTAVTPNQLELFEENELLIDSKVNLLLEQIYAEYQGQLRELDEASADSSVPIQRISRDSIERYIRDQLDDYVSRKSRPVPSYGLFARISNQTSQKAQELERSRILGFVKKVNLPISAEFIKRCLAQQPENHVSPEASSRYFLQHLSLPTREEVAKAYSTRGGKQDSFADDSSYFVKLLQDRTLDAVLTQRLSKAIEEQLPALRNQFAEEQIKQSFDVKEWSPSEEQITEAYLRARRKIAFNEAEQMIPHLSSSSRPVFIAEAKELLVEQIEAKLNSGITALKDQMDATRAMFNHQRNAQLLESQVISGLEKRSIVEHWQTALGDELRQGHPDEVIHARLMRLPALEVEKLVSLKFDAVKQAAAAKLAFQSRERSQRTASFDARTANDTTPIVPPGGAGNSVGGSGAPGGGSGADDPGGGAGNGGGQGNGDGTGDGDGDGVGSGRDKADVHIVLGDGTRGECLARLPGSQRPDVPFNPHEFAASAHAIVNAFTPEIETTIQKKIHSVSQTRPTSQTTPRMEFKVYLEINSVEVRHVMSIRIRTLIDDVCRRHSTKSLPIVLEWGDGA